MLLRLDVVVLRADKKKRGGHPRHGAADKLPRSIHAEGWIANFHAPSSRACYAWRARRPPTDASPVGWFECRTTGPPGALGAPEPEPPPVAWYASRCIPTPPQCAGRFPVLTRGGVVEPNLVRKDTARVRTGEVMNILLDVSNPGLWMALCHIAEHAEAGMIFSYGVTPA